VRQEVTNIKRNTPYEVSGFIKVLKPVAEKHTVQIVVIQRIGESQ
jgi:hypothetical protein